MELKLIYSLLIVRPEGKVTQEAEVVVIGVAVVSGAVAVIEAAEAVEGEVEDEVDTARHQGVRSGSQRVRMPFRSDRPTQRVWSPQSSTIMLYVHI